MSQENVEAFRRATDAYNRRDVEALLDEAHPEVEWHSVILARLEGGAPVYRGREGIRNLFRDLDGAFAEIRADYPDIRDLGDLILAIGSIQARGRESGAEIKSSAASVIDFRDGKAIRVRTYLDPEEALEAAGLRE
jgi:ketosteroid isomerase-like protein